MSQENKTSKKTPKRPSKIRLEEYFAAGDELFLDELRKFKSAKYLSSIATKWTSDQRPWAREQALMYLDGGLNLPGHEVVFKRLFKKYEKDKDYEVMGQFLVTLDRMVRRVRSTKYHYDWNARTSWTTERLWAKPNRSIEDQLNRFTEATYGGRTYQYPLPPLRNKKTNMIFGHKTRNYLRRRVWRMFRHLSFREPDVYLRELSRALLRYRDEDFATGENIIDNWSLMHACYFNHRAITFTNAHTNISQGHSLDELSPAPYQPKVWLTSDGANSLFNLLSEAKGSVVRLWAMEFLARDHSEFIENISIEFLIRLLASPDARVQQFAAELFRKHPKLPTLELDQWFRLLDESGPNVLGLICEAMREHVAEERLENSQLIQMACKIQVPVSQIGFDYLRQRHATQPISADQLKELAGCECRQQVHEITTWTIDEIERSGYSADNVVDFFDSLQQPMRAAALNWLSNSESKGYDDVQLWTRLVEAPFGDVRIRMVEHLEKRLSLPGKETDDLAPLWASVILNVHTGGRTKPKAVRQLSKAVADEPSRAEKLIPVLAIALRSVRRPEMRTALSSIVTLALEKPELRSQIESAIPELNLGSLDAVVVGAQS